MRIGVHGLAQGRQCNSRLGTEPHSIFVPPQTPKPLKTAAVLSCPLYRMWVSQELCWIPFSFSDFRANGFEYQYVIQLKAWFHMIIPKLPKLPKLENFNLWVPDVDWKFLNKSWSKKRVQYCRSATSPKTTSNAHLLMTRNNTSLPSSQRSSLPPHLHLY